LKLHQHHDPLGLEQRLLDRLVSLRDEGSGPLLIIVPTRQLCDHLSRRLLERSPAWLGVEIEPVGALVCNILAGEGLDRRETLAESQLEMLAERHLRSTGSRDEWSAFLRRRPRALRRMMAALKDLREADVPAADVRASATTESENSLATWYDWYRETIAEQEQAGRLDGAASVQSATSLARGWAERYTSILIHGAYDWIGINLKLFQQLSLGAAVELFLPFTPGLAATTTAETFWARFGETSLGDIQVSEPPPTDDPRYDLAILFDEDTDATGTYPVAIEMLDCQGPRAEVETAIGLMQAAILDGVSVDEVVLVARGIDAYAPSLEAILTEQEIPFSSTHRDTLARVPWVRELLTLIRVVREDFPRATTIELLQSRHIDLSSLCGGAALPGAIAVEAWSRENGVVGGRDGWEEALASSPDDKRPERLLEFIEAVHGAIEPNRDRRWAEWVELFRRVVAPVGQDSWNTVLEEMAGLAALLKDEVVGFGAATQWLEQAVERTEYQPFGARDGLRILDLQQLRGQTADVVIGIGFHAGQFPASVREDPILGEDLRQRLQHQGHPISLRNESGLEERQLLVALVGAARRRLILIRQRANDAGQTVAPSSYARQLDRLQSVPMLASRVPSHPRHALEHAVSTRQILDPNGLWLLRAFRSRNREDDRERLCSAPEWSDGMRMIEQTEDFSGDAGIFDARVKPRVTEELSVSAFELLGKCPLQYWFRHVLGVRALDESPLFDSLSHRTMGSAVHALLQQCQPILFKERPDVDRNRVEAVIDRHWPDTVGALGRRLARELPALWKWEEQRWRRAIVDFVCGDLARMAVDKWQTIEVEQPLEFTLSVGDRTVTLLGRLDRILTGRGEDGGTTTLIGDYKTSRSVKDLVSPSKILRAEHLQSALYWRGVEGAPVEMLAISPDVKPGPRDAIGNFAGFASEDKASGFEETLGLVARFHIRGSFPFSSGSHCTYCSFSSACRRLHPPSDQREQLDIDGRRIRSVKLKSLKAPLVPDEIAPGAADG